MTFHISVVNLNHYENTPIQIYCKLNNQKREKIPIKNSDIFYISAQNIDCGYSLEPPRRGGSNEYPQSVFLSRNKKNNVYPCKPQFYYIKVGLKGVKIILVCFRDGESSQNFSTKLSEHKKKMLKPSPTEPGLCPAFANSVDSEEAN